jgi:hypothetical protein
LLPFNLVQGCESFVRVQEGGVAVVTPVDGKTRTGNLDPGVDSFETGHFLHGNL